MANNSIEPSPKRKFKFSITCHQSTQAQRSLTRLPLPEPPPVPSLGRPESVSNAMYEEADGYAYYVVMVSDILTPQVSDQHWRARMPCARRHQHSFFKGNWLYARRKFGSSTLSCSASNPVALAKTLISRLKEQPVGLNNSQLEAWPLYRSLVRSRVLRFINTWIDQYWIHKKDLIAGLHIKDFFLRTDDQFELEERDEILRKLDEQREMAISLAPSGISAD